MRFLSLLAGASLQGPEGPLTGAAVQRRRLALLALLARAPNARLSRDKLIGWLWPEHATDRARHLLSESVYVIRKALGENAVVTLVDDLVLDTGVVRVDVVEFEAALRKGMHAEAVSLYAGPFLDGFYLPDAPEFERWLDGERDLLERAYRSALETVAVQCEQSGDRVAAVDAWRKLAARDPLSTRVALALMHALEASGEPAAALEHARVHTTLLREEVGAAPAPELTAFVDRLRTQRSESKPPIVKPVTVEGDVVVNTTPVPALPPPTHHRRRLYVGVAAAALLLAVWSGWHLIVRAPAASAGVSAPTAEAQLMYLRGRFVWNKRTPEGLQQAVEFFERAIALDSGYAAAYAGLADSYISLYDHGLVSLADASPKVRAAALRALQLNPHLAEAHTSLAHVHLHDWRWADAEREFRIALELDSARAQTYHWYALALTTVGRVGDAVAAMRKAVELDPLSVRMNADLGMALFAARDYDRAIEQEKATLELEPAFPTAHWIAAMAYEQKGLIAEAVRELAQARAQRPNSASYLASLVRLHALSGRTTEARALLEPLETRARAEEGLAFFVALGYAVLDRERAFEWLDKAVEEHSGSIRYLKVDPRLDVLRADPRYHALLRRAGLQP